MALEHKIYNEDGTFTIRDFTPDELAQQAKDIEEAEAIKAAEAKQATALATATTKLTALGLTAADLKALGL